MVGSYRRNKKIITLFLLPALLIYGLFLIVPTISGVLLSFYNWAGYPGAPFQFQGLKNFATVVNYSPFWQSIRNILWWIVLTLVTQIPIGFLLANLFSSRFSGFRVFKAIVFLPQVISATVIGLLWYFVLRPDGVLNTTLTTFGAAALGRDWLVNPGTAMTSVILVNTWIGIGFHMTLFFAAISSIPDSILDSCKLDGITGARKLFRITVPLTWETLRVCLIIAITQSLRAFDLVFVMTEGGPNGLTDIPATLLYRESFRFQRFGVGSSIGVLILLISLIFTLISLRLLRRETVEY